MLASKVLLHANFTSSNRGQLETIRTEPAISKCVNKEGRVSSDRAES